MKKTSIAAVMFIIACALFLCACRQAPPAPGPTPGPSPVPKPEDVTYNSEIEAMVVGRNITVENTFKSGYFRKNSTIFDKKLAMLSCSFACSSSLDDAKKALSSMYFDDIFGFQNDGSDVNGCSYVFGHRSVDNYELVAVHIQGLGYGPEWSGNLYVGNADEREKDHVGFDIAGEKVYTALKDYVAENLADKNLKIWISGYSRAGGISCVLACDIIDGKELDVTSSNIYVYTFEAPVSVSARRAIKGAVKYTCIHNIVVEADIVPHLLPSSYGMARPGRDRVTSADPDYVNSCLHEIIGDDANMPEFSATADYSTPAEYLAYLIGEIENAKAENPEVPSLESREKYVSTVQERIRYLAEVLLKDNGAGENGLIAYVKEMIEDAPLSLYSVWVTNKDGFYEGSDNPSVKGLKQILEECGVTYDDASLKNACSLLPSLLLNEGLVQLVVKFINFNDPGFRNNAMYTVNCHYPGVVYSLLKKM